MKKKILFVLMLLGLALISVPQVHANDDESVYRNLLDLRNLYMDRSGLGASTLSDIELKPGESYTFVASFDFLGRNLWLKNQFYIDLQFNPIDDYRDLLAIVDEDQQLVYVEFIASTAFMHLYFLPIDAENTNFDIILYEGIYEDFQGFIPYMETDYAFQSKGILAMDYDAQMTTSAILNLVSAKSPEGNPLPIQLIQDTYSSSNKLPNRYQMIFESMHATIKKQFVLDIHVLDVSPPIIMAPTLIEIPINQKKTIAEILALLSVSDNVTPLSVSDLVIVEDTYTSKHTLGTASLTVKATDSSGNQTLKVVHIELVDKEGPLLSGPRAIYLYATDQPLSNETLLSKFDAYDLVDGHQVTVVIQNNHYLQNPNPGIYDVTIVAYDTKMNATVYPIKIHVIENRGPVFHTDEMIMKVQAGQTVTDEAIKDWFNQEMSASGFVILGTEIMYNEYQLSNQKPGQYYVFLKFNHQEEEHTSRIILDIEPSKIVSFWLISGIGSCILIGISLYFILNKKKI